MKAQKAGVPKIRLKRAPKAEPYRALQVLIEETAELNRVFCSALAEVRESGEAPAARPIMRRLSRAGAQSVPQLARYQRVSRQHIQTTVNGLVEQGLVAATANPAHRRSSLLHLTATGFAVLRAADLARRSQLEAASDALAASELYGAVQTLRQLRRRLNVTTNP